MLRISKKSDYAIFLLTSLAQSEGARGEAERGEIELRNGVRGNGERGRPQQGDPSALRSAAELARRSGLNRSLVANLLKEYARAGILESVRGQHGGYRLARPAESVTLRQILQVTEGPIAFVDCASHTSPSLVGASTNGSRPHRTRDGQPASQPPASQPPASQPHGPDCGLAGQCPSRAPLLVLHRRLLALLDSVSLHELAQPVRFPPIREFPPLHEIRAEEPVYSAPQSLKTTGSKTKVEGPR